MEGTTITWLVALAIIIGACAQLATGSMAAYFGVFFFCCLIILGLDQVCMAIRNGKE